MNYDIVVIGAGPGGYVAAIRAAQLGAKVAVVEKEELGGTCLNRGCIPTKTLLATTNLFSSIKKASSYGIKTDNPSVDFASMMDRKNKVVKQLRSGIEYLFKTNKIEHIKGTVKFLNKNEIEVSSGISVSTIQSSKFMIATGSIPANIPGIEIDHKKILNSDDILELQKVPSSLLIIGAGAIGVEFACIFNALGCKVTLVEMLSNILPVEDEEISDQLKQYLTKDGIVIETGLKVKSEKLKDYEKVLVAVGRKPYTDGLELEKLGISKQSNGAIAVNNKMETNIPGVYAIGDVAGGVLLAHKASAEGIVAAENACGKESAIDYKVIPSCVYSMPEVASAGLKESAARKSGYEINVSKFPFIANGRAVTLGETRGMVKIITDKKTDAILGVHIIGPEATELITEAALAIKLECTIEELTRIIHPHPTLSEAIFEAADTL